MSFRSTRQFMRYMQSMHHGRRRQQRRRLKPMYGPDSYMEHDREVSERLNSGSPMHESASVQGLIHRPEPTQ